MSDEIIGQVVTSSSSDCEAVYTGEIQGLQRLWKERFNKAHLHFGDRAHKIESMLGKIRKDAEMKWLDDILSKLDNIISKICQSPKQHRNLRYTATLSDSLVKSMKRLVETRFVRYLVGSIDALLTNAYVLELLWQQQAADGDTEVRGHLKNLVDPLFIPSLLVLADVFSQSVFASEIAQSDIYPLWEDKENVERFLVNIKKINEIPILENPLNKRLQIHYPNVKNGMFTPNANKPDQFVNLLQNDVQFQPRLSGHQQVITLDVITETVEDRVKQLTSAILQEAAIFLALNQQEQHIVNIFDVKSFAYHNPERLREQYNEDFLIFAHHLDNGNLSFPRDRCGEVCAGIDCSCLLDQYIAFKERVCQNKEKFEDVWFTKNQAGQVTWKTTNVLSYFQKPEFGLHEHIPDLVEIIEICLIMSRS